MNSGPIFGHEWIQDIGLRDVFCGYILSCKTSASTHNQCIHCRQSFQFTLSKELMTIAPAFTIGLCGLSAQETRVCFHLLALTMRNC